MTIFVVYFAVTPPTFTLRSGSPRSFIRLRNVEQENRVADHYEAAVDNAVDSLSSLIEPIIMSVLGISIGGLMIAMCLPFFMLGSVI